VAVVDQHVALHLVVAAATVQLAAAGTAVQEIVAAAREDRVAAPQDLVPAPVAGPAATRLAITAPAASVAVRLIATGRP